MILHVNSCNSLSKFFVYLSKGLVLFAVFQVHTINSSLVESNERRGLIYCSPTENGFLVQESMIKLGKIYCLSRLIML